MSWLYRQPRCKLCHLPAYYNHYGDDLCARHYAEEKRKDVIGQWFAIYQQAGLEAEYTRLFEATEDGPDFYNRFQNVLREYLRLHSEECECRPDGNGPVCKSCRERVHSDSLPY